MTTGDLPDESATLEAVAYERSRNSERTPTGPGLANRLSTLNRTSFWRFYPFQETGYVDREVAGDRQRVLIARVDNHPLQPEWNYFWYLLTGKRPAAYPESCHGSPPHLRLERQRAYQRADFLLASRMNGVIDSR